MSTTPHFVWEHAHPYSPFSEWIDGKIHIAIRLFNELSPIGRTLSRRSRARRQTMEPKKPIQSFAAGGIRLAIWSNPGKGMDGQESEYLTLKIERRYLDNNGAWQSTASLRVNDVPKAIALLSQAYANVIVKQAEPKSAASSKPQ